MVKKVAGTSGVFATSAKTVATRVGDIACLKHDKFIGRSLQVYGEWAQHEIDQLLSYIRPGDFVLDIGANLGFHSLSFARKVGSGGQVWAFEPDPVNALLLRLNIINAGMDAVVVPFDLAVSDRTELCHFRTYPIAFPENFGHTAVDEIDGTYPRAGFALDMLDVSRPPSLIKIDIEGHELAALKGMASLIERHAPVLSVEADSDEDAERLCDFVCGLGYDVYDFVTDAFNKDNFAGAEQDIWNGHGVCRNLLCLKPGRHAPPADLPLRRSAAIVGPSLAGLAATGGLSSVQPRPDSATSATTEGYLVDSRALRGEIRSFVGSFVRSTYGKLDPLQEGALIDSAVSYLSADGAEPEAEALRSFVVASVNAFARALGRAAEVDRLEHAERSLQLVKAELERDLAQARDEIGALRQGAADAEAARATLHEVQRHGDELQARYDIATAELAGLKAQIGDLDEACQRANADALHARETATQLNAVLQRVTTAASRDLAEAQNEAEALREAAKQTADEAERLRAELAAVAAQRDEARGSAAPLLDEVAALRRALGEAEAERDRERAAEPTAAIDAAEFAALRLAHEDALARLSAQAQEIRRLRALS